MDADRAALLARLVRNSRVAALATLRSGMPNVSMVAYLAAADFSAFILRVSRLAWHTQDMEREPRVALGVIERDDGRREPQTLARVTLRGEAERLPGEGREHDALRGAWLERFPEAAATFALADFSFWRVVPREARFVAGLGRTHNLSAAGLREAADARAAGR